jgi:endonuclease III
VAKPSEQEIARALLRRHGRTFADELGIPVEKNTPSPLFRLLCASLLFSARIGANIALRAARALTEQGWTTPEKMAASTWEERARTLNEAGYARYDERTSTMLGETAEALLERYGGDLRRLREEAGRDPDEERRLLKEFKGIGDVGVDVFFREAQVSWNELFPFADRRALEEAGKLGLREDAGSLLRLVADEDFPQLVATLVRVRLEGDREEILEEARGS